MCANQLLNLQPTPEHSPVSCNLNYRVTTFTYSKDAAAAAILPPAAVTGNGRIGHCSVVQPHSYPCHSALIRGYFAVKTLTPTTPCTSYCHCISNHNTQLAILSLPHFLGMQQKLIWTATKPFLPRAGDAIHPVLWVQGLACETSSQFLNYYESGGCCVQDFGDPTSIDLQNWLRPKPQSCYNCSQPQQEKILREGEYPILACYIVNIVWLM